jgi:hypothetical protein
MSDSVLLRFLSGGLVNVGGDDTKLEKLQATSQGVAGILKKHPSKVPNYSLIAFDPEAPPDDPVTLEVLGILKEAWPTYVNTFASTPIQVLRAIILDALVSSAQEDERVAVAVAACARSVLPFMETGNEFSIWLDVVDKIEDSVDRRAEEEWSTPAGIDIPPFAASAISPIKVGNSAVKIDREAFKQQFSSAAQGAGGFNIHNPMPWFHSFANALADPIAETLDKVSANAKVNAVDLSTPLQELGKAVSSYVSSAVKAFGTATAGLQRRTNLIWWKQSLYSLSKRKSYRTFPRTVAASLMAFDLYQQIPMFSPASVSAFLEEAIHSLPESNDPSGRPLKEIVAETCVDPSVDVLRTEASKLFAVPNGRSPILALIGHSSGHASSSDLDLRKVVGVSPDVRITDAQWASWIFRDLQAGRASKEQPKKRNGKGQA